MNTLAGVDGCAGGWLCVLEEGARLTAFVVESFPSLLDRLPEDALVAIDVPIGLTDRGARECDLAARRYLRAPRASSVFPAPVRAALPAGTYAEACAAHLAADGRRMSKQAFAILPKVKEVDTVILQRPELQNRVREIHPEVCFAVWNGGRAMQHKKSLRAGRAERELLIDAVWPGERERLRRGLRQFRHQADDLNDAFAALWTARRIHEGTALVFPPTPAVDQFSLRMEMLA
jgi:predicted RNase H-like nuclease